MDCAQARRKRLEDEGLAPFTLAVEDGKIEASAIAIAFERTYLESLSEQAFRGLPRLHEFSGSTHESMISRFCALDREFCLVSRAKVQDVHFRAIPRSTEGEMKTVRRQIELKIRHKPIRQLLKDAGRAVQLIKPVFLMSPISAAQFLEPGQLEFDLLLIDEASQVRPVEALGVAARCKQMIVVGDEKQLPPTKFFSKLLDEDPSNDEHESDDERPGDLESILSLCQAQGMPTRMLRWHYRSRCHSLIAVSNKEFYDNKLYVVPSRKNSRAGDGLQFRYVENGVYDRGDSATNQVEAKAVAEAVVEHARLHPELSLGVGAFSIRQRDAIIDEIESLRRSERGLDEFFATGKVDPFFVKNLENIQGDERDVIFISVGYARDESGRLLMNFGPLSNEGGERRLNVLITRTRLQCIVFSSITGDDLDLNRSKSRGVAALKTFLSYARSRILDGEERPAGASTTAFASSIEHAIQSLGHKVHSQVGSGGFRIELAVVDPERPEQYLLGIDSDGPNYRSARSARDRDRLREAALKDRGWMLERVWAADWHSRPNEELRRLAESIENARRKEPSQVARDAIVETIEPVPSDDHTPNADEEAASDAQSALSSQTTQIKHEVVVDPLLEIDQPTQITNSGSDLRQEEPKSDALSSQWATVYVEAYGLTVPTEEAIHEVSTRQLADIVTKVVQIEAPIHREEIARRVTTLWGLDRTGSRITEAVQRAIEFADGAGGVVLEGEFVFVSQHAHVLVRDRSSTASANLRKLEMISNQEIQTAILQLASEHIGLDPDSAGLLASRAFGFKSTSPKLKERMQNSTLRMVQEGRIVLRDGRLYIP